MDNPLYVSKHWSVTEWDCWRRSRNEYAWDENGRLCTNDEKTANLFRIFDMLRDWNLIGLSTLPATMKNMALTLNQASGL